MNLTLVRWVTLRGLFIGAFLACIVSGHSEPTNAPPQVRQPPSFKIMLEDWVARTAAENDPEYTGIFTELGLKPEDQERFKSQLAELHRKAIAAGEPMRELLEARIAYDKELHAALGDKNYQHYRDYEDSKPAWREYELIREFAWSSNNLAMDPTFYDKIIQLIRESKATTTETWHGPYDPQPHPGVGQQMILVELNRRLSELRPASSNLNQRLSKSQLPGEYQRLLGNYYSHKIAELEEATTRFSLPEEELKRRVLLEENKLSQELRLKRSSNSTNLVF